MSPRRAPPAISLSTSSAVTTRTRRRRSKLLALPLLASIAALVILASVATSARAHGLQPVPRQAHSRTSSSSSSSAKPTSSGSSSKNTSSSSSIQLTLPDSFVQCEPANITIDSVIGSKDASLLGGSADAAQEATWLNLQIRVQRKKNPHLDLDLPSNTTYWTWPYVDLPAGTSFSIMVSSITNQSMEADDDASSTTSARTSVATNKSSSRNRNDRRAVEPDLADDEAILAHSLVRSNVVEGDLNVTSCLPVGTSPDDEPNLNATSSNHHGKGTAASQHQSGPSHAVTIVAGFLGGLVGLFIALLIGLGWHRRKENRRRRLQGDSGAATPDFTNGGTTDRRSIPIATWDGEYRSSPRGGWNYMTSLVPGLSMGEPPGFNSPSPSPTEGGFGVFRGRRRAGPTNRRREDGEEDLPTYGKSEEEIKGLPSYEPGMGLRNLAAAPGVDGDRHHMEMTEERYRDDVDDGEEDDRLSTIGEQDETMAMANSPTPPTTMLQYLPSGPTRPYSSLDLVSVPLPTRAPSAEVSQSMTMGNVNRRPFQHPVVSTTRSARTTNTNTRATARLPASAVTFDPFASTEEHDYHRQASGNPSSLRAAPSPSHQRTRDANGGLLEDEEDYDDQQSPLLIQTARTTTTTTTPSPSPPPAADATAASNIANASVQPPRNLRMMRSKQFEGANSSSSFERRR